MSTSVIINLVSGIAILAALLFLNRATRKPIVPDAAGRMHLRMNKLYSLIGIIAMLMGAGLATVILFREKTPDIPAVITSLTILAVFCGAGTTSLLFYYNHRVAFDDTTIAVANPFGKITIVLWNELASTHTSSVSGFVTLHTAAGKIKIHQHLVGLSHLGNKLVEKKGWVIPRLNPNQSTSRL